MSSHGDIEKRLQELGRAVGSDESLSRAVMARLRRDIAGVGSSSQNHKTSTQHTLWRFTLNRPIKLAAAAAILVAVALAVGFWDRLGSPAYAIEQTAQAMRNVRYMHIVKRDKAGNLEDERWEEIDANGVQARYRQNTPIHSFYVIDDRQTVMVYHAGKEKNTVILYDPHEEWYTWHHAPGKMFDEIAEGKPNYVVVAEKVQYKGRPAHHLRWVVDNADVYVDPQTKLPIAMGDYEFSFEEPPEGIFDIVIPEGAFVVDKRPGAAPGPEPEWMVKERERKEMGKVAQQLFEQGRRELAAGRFAEAATSLTQCLEIAPRNWAQFWLGKALYASARYDEAIYQLTRVIEMVAEHKASIPSYYLARAMAYQGKGMTDMAQIDFEKVLPTLIESLRNSKAAWSFNLADDPLQRADGMNDEDCHEAPTPQQSLIMMINRLRILTGQNFGFDPNGGDQEKERAIAAWEQWAKESGRFQFTPDAPLIPAPRTGNPETP